MSAARVERIWAPALVVLATLAPAAVAQDRRPQIDVQQMTIDAEVNPRTQSLSATATLRFVPKEDRVQSAVFELNNALQLSRVVDSTGRQIPASRSHDDFSIRVSFPEPLAKDQPVTLAFTYDGSLTGSEESPVYGINFAAIKDDHAYLLYPARWFPVNDYTADRFAATLKIKVPAGFRVLGSGIETHSDVEDGTLYQFDFNHESFPGSIAVVQGDPYRSTSEGVTTLLYFRGDTASMAAQYGEEVGKMMTLLTGLYGLPPSSSLTVVQTDAGTPNGYTAPGMLFLNPSAIGTQVNTRLLANQIARQWWGMLISPVNRNHIWLTNGAARFAELYWTEQTAGKGAYETELRDVDVEALTVDEPPIIQSSRLEDYSPEYWAVTGAKGAAVFSMLRYVVGDEPFFKMLKAFPENHAWQSVSTDDLRKSIEELSGRNLQGFFIQWIESTGAPEFKLSYTVYRTSNGFRIMGKINQDLDLFRMPVELQIETEGNPETKQVDVVGTSSEFVIDTFGKPKKVNIDPDNHVLRMNDKMRVAVAIRRGEMYTQISEFGDALREYQKALDVNRNSSLAHYRVAEIHLLQRSYQQAADEFRQAQTGDLDPAWIEVWSWINLGNIFDITGQRERAVNAYNQAIRTKDNTANAQEIAAKYLKEPYERPAQGN